MHDFHKRSNKTRHNQVKRHLQHEAKRRRPEDHKRLKEQARKRKSEQTSRGPRRRDWDEDDDVDTFEKIQRRPSAPPTGRRHDAPAGAPPVPATEHGGPPSDSRPGVVDEAPSSSGDALDMLTGRVVSVARGRATIAFEGGTVEAELCAALAATQQTALAVGDIVSWSRTSGHARVEEVHPRRTTLSRPDPANPHRRRILAANVDVAALVVSTRRPALKPGLVDRFLLALEHGGVEPVVVVNKLDLLASERERERVEEILAPYPALGVPTVCVSAESGHGLDELSCLLTGRTSVLVGHSGVGKSTLLNALDPDGQRRTRSGRTGDGKGRHTTTSSSLTELPDGTVLIDTPGVRAFGLWDMDRVALRQAFPELVEHSGGCRFRDCSHLVEPDCAVRAAVASGAIPQARFDAYGRIHESLAP